jgi:glycosyltransferase involved in cell wall biosynthesis
LDIVVVCNGCSDDSAAIARRFGPPVRVIETAVPSKTNALNLGDAAASSFPRIYLDADVIISHEAVRQLAEAVTTGGALAAAPMPINVFLPGTAWSVRAFYRLWTALPHIGEGMIASGAYALSEAGRSRFGQFPDLIADDGFVRVLFEPHERMQVSRAASHVYAPLTLEYLLKIKTRSRLGVLQLRERYPELTQREAKTKDYKAGLLTIFSRPSLYLATIPYAYVSLISRFRAEAQNKTLAKYIWERDESSREVKGSAAL